MCVVLRVGNHLSNSYLHPIWQQLYNCLANVGHFDKHLTVKFAGIDEMKSITLTGDVVSAEEFDKLKPEAKATPASAAVPAKPVKKAKKTK